MFVGVGVPVSLRPPPASLDEKVDVQNNLGLGVMQFPLGYDLETVMYQVKLAMEKRFKLGAMWGSQKIQLTMKYVPEVVCKQLVDVLSSTGKFVVSNIPGFKKQITIGGYALEDSILVTPHCFKTGSSILGYTYDGKFRFSVFFDQGVEANAKEMLRYVQAEIQEQIRNL
jgi:hypothetical protein